VSRPALDVTDSRLPDWKKTTGQFGSWLVPDWSSVVREYDAVHVSVFGYLTTAGRAVPVDADNSTVMAGWGPEETFWLGAALTVDGPASHWNTNPDGDWRQTAR